MDAKIVKTKGVGGHHRAYRGRTDEWITPPDIIHSLGPFDLDPCSPINRPWDTATNHYTVNDDGLRQPWSGRVWLNPPYGPDCVHWLRKLADHGNGIALIFARTETEMFFEQAWNRASALLFLRGRLHFHYVTGDRARCNAGGPSVLVAYGRENVLALRRFCITGKVITLRNNEVPALAA